MKKTLRIVFGVLLALVLLVGSIPASAYTNSWKLPQQDVSLGDPFILKYDGVYYLYTSHQCWSSKDLANWEYEGYMWEEGGPNTDGVYAAEVIYKDGLFIAQGAPYGNGHYFYTSTTPTGPFVCATENLGMKFDGTVFMDNDNQVYLIVPSSGCLTGYYMSDFLTMNFDLGSFRLDDTSIQKAWTEGPTLFKRDGYYYTTYTGNHVWENSYRVEYAISDSVTTGWTEPVDNTVLLDIEGKVYGTGHNSIFIGPDLDTYYITYHSIAEKVKETSVYRAFNYDRIVWNGEKMVVQGPTSWEVDNPAMPDFSEYFDADLAKWDAEGSWTVKNGGAVATSGTLLTKESTEDVFTAEFNLTTAGSADMLFSYQDANNYGRAWVDRNAKQFKAELVKDGNVVWSDSSALYSYYNYDVLHTVRVQQTANKLNLYLDGVDRISYEHNGLTGGKIGYKAVSGESKASFTAFSHKALGSADGEIFTPIPGTIEAVNTQDNAAKLTVVDAVAGEMGYAVDMKAGDKATYNIHTVKADTYTLGLRVGEIAEGTKLNVLVDGKKAMEVTMPANAGDSYRTLPLRGLKLPDGKRTVSIEVVSGSMELYELEINLEDAVELLTSDCTTAKGDDGAVFWKQSEAMPTWTDGTLNFTDASAYGKLLAGDIGIGDYTVETDVKFESGSGSAGVLLRVAHYDNGIVPGTTTVNRTYHQGYYVGLKGGAVVLEKHNFGDVKVLKEQSYNIYNGKNYNLKVTAVGDTITVYVDDTEVFTYTDSVYPLLNGRAGIRADRMVTSFDNFKLEAAEPAIAVTMFEVDYSTPAITDDIPDGTDDGGSAGNGSLDNSLIGLIIGIVAGVIVIAAVIVIVVLKGNKKAAPAAETKSESADEASSDQTEN